MSLRERIGIDVGGDLTVREAVEWAADHGVRYVDVRIDDALEGGYDEAEAAAIRETCEAGDVRLGLHDSSAVNMAEVAPFVRDATDDYLEAYVAAAEALGAEWLVVHGGFHFGDADRRAEAAIDRLARANDRADGVDLLLENHNPEPDGGEIQYMPVTVGECERFLGALDLGWAFTANHAHMRPAGVDGFLDALPVERCGEVRLADNRGGVEEHLYPGEGTIDFAGLFDRLERAGFDGHYMLAFGTLEEMLEGREYLVDAAG